MRGFWEFGHGAALPTSAHGDRQKTATTLAARADWLLGGGLLSEDALGSYALASKLLTAEWKADPLTLPPLQLWAHVSWRLANLAEGAGDASAICWPRGWAKASQAERGLASPGAPPSSEVASGSTKTSRAVGCATAPVRSR